MRFTKVHEESQFHWRPLYYQTKGIRHDIFSEDFGVKQLLFGLTSFYGSVNSVVLDRPCLVLFLLFVWCYFNHELSICCCVSAVVCSASILIISPLATRKGCLGVVGFLPFGCNFISSIFLQFSDESHISSLDLTDQN